MTSLIQDERNVKSVGEEERLSASSVRGAVHQYMQHSFVQKLETSMERSPSSSTLSDINSPQLRNIDNSRDSVVGNSPSSVQDASVGTSSTAEFQSVSGNSRPSSRTSSPGAYNDTAPENSSCPSPSKYPRREAPQSNTGAADSSYPPGWKEGTLNGQHVMSVPDTLGSSGSPRGRPLHMFMGGNIGSGGHHPPDTKPDTSSLASLSANGDGFLNYYHPPGIDGAGNGMPSSTHEATIPRLPPQMPSPGRHSSVSSLRSLLCSPPTGSSSSSGSPHPSLQDKHICAICGDRASGKHYGVYSCEGCKCFFKRTGRKELIPCRGRENCIIDKRQRKRCQYCRYMKCLSMGMRREVKQEERQPDKEEDEESDSSSGANNDIPVERILQAELAVNLQIENCIDLDLDMVLLRDPVLSMRQAADRQLFIIVQWAKRIPHFIDLSVGDRIILLRTWWNELIIAALSHRSMDAEDGMYLVTGFHIHRSTAHKAGFGLIFDRILRELVAKMRELKMDKTELGCLRAVVLFNHNSEGLTAVQEVAQLRNKVYASFKEYCKTQYPDQPRRFTRLLMRLPALRSISLDCPNHPYFYVLIGYQPRDTLLMEMLQG